MNQSKRIKRIVLQAGKKLSLSIMTSLMLTLPLSQVAFAISDAEVTTAVQRGTDYLEANQNDDGSIVGYGGETEWSVIAFEATGRDSEMVKSDDGNSIVDFLESEKPVDATPATTIERKILAINASGNDSKYFDGVDYNQELKNFHNNDQIGEITLLNDDFFGVLAIETTEDSELLESAQDALDYFLIHQRSDGGFSYTTNECDFYCGTNSNDTAAAIQAMYSAERMGLTNVLLITAKDRAIVYLLSTQKDDGCFGYDAFSPSDGSSTAWGLMTLNVIGQSVFNQASSARTCLLGLQNSDGGFRFGAYGINDSDTYTTAHAVIALAGSSWTLYPLVTKKPELNLEKTQSLETPSVSNIVASLAGSSVHAQGASRSDTNKDNIDKKQSGSVLKSEDKGWLFAGGPLALILVAFAWYLLQSRSKKTEKV